MMTDHLSRMELKAVRGAHQLLREARAPTLSVTCWMRLFTLTRMSLERSFLAAGCSVMLSRKTTHSACPPFRMTPELARSRLGAVTGLRPELDAAAGISRCSSSLGIQREKRFGWEGARWADCAGSAPRPFLTFLGNSFPHFWPLLLLLPLEMLSPPPLPPPPPPSSAASSPRRPRCSCRVTSGNQAVDPLETRHPFLQAS